MEITDGRSQLHERNIVKRDQQPKYKISIDPTTKGGAVAWLYEVVETYMGAEQLDLIIGEAHYDRSLFCLIAGHALETEDDRRPRHERQYDYDALPFKDHRFIQWLIQLWVRVSEVAPTFKPATKLDPKAPARLNANLWGNAVLQSPSTGPFIPASPTPASKPPFTVSSRTNIKQAQNPVTTVTGAHDGHTTAVETLDGGNKPNGCSNAPLTRKGTELVKAAAVGNSKPSSTNAESNPFSLDSPSHPQSDNSDDDLDIENDTPSATLSFASGEFSEPHTFFLPETDAPDCKRLQKQLLQDLINLNLRKPKQSTTDVEDGSASTSRAADRRDFKGKVYDIVRLLCDYLSGETAKANFDQWRAVFLGIEGKYLRQDGKDLGLVESTRRAVNSAFETSQMDTASTEDKISKLVKALQFVERKAAGSIMWKWKSFEAHHDLWQAMTDLEERASIVSAWSLAEHEDSQDSRLKEVSRIILDSRRKYPRKKIAAILNDYWDDKLGCKKKATHNHRRKARAIYELTKVFGRAAWILLPENALDKIGKLPIWTSGSAMALFELVKEKFIWLEGFFHSFDNIHSARQMQHILKHERSKLISYNIPAKMSTQQHPQRRKASNTSNSAGGLARELNQQRNQQPAFEPRASKSSAAVEARPISKPKVATSPPPANVPADLPCSAPLQRQPMTIRPLQPAIERSLSHSDRPTRQQSILPTKRRLSPEPDLRGNQRNQKAFSSNARRSRSPQHTGIPSQNRNDRKKVAHAADDEVREGLISDVATRRANKRAIARLLEKRPTQ